MIEIDDLRAFGLLVREKRKTLRLSQEALAAEAFGNASRKGYISSMENGRLKGVQPETVRRIAYALELSRQDIPWALRWPEPEVTTGELQTHGKDAMSNDPRLAQLMRLVDSAVRGMHGRLQRSPFELYTDTLSKWLRKADLVLGRPFGLRSFLICLSVAFGYVFLTWVVASGRGGGMLGELELLGQPSWSFELSQSSLAFAITLLTAGAACVCFSWALPRSTDRLPTKENVIGYPWRIQAVRLIASACLLGITVSLLAALGVNSIVAGMLVVVFGLCALSYLAPGRAAIVGAAAGILASFLESSVTHLTFTNGFEGAIFGCIVGGSAAYVAASVAKGAQGPIVGGVSGAGVGAMFGAATALVIFALLDFMSAGTSEPRAAGGLHLLKIGDSSYNVLAVVWVVLPTVNAALDFVSYGVSRWLAEVGIRSRAKAKHFVGLALVDLCAATALAALTLGLICAFLWISNWVLSFGLDVDRFLTAWIARPFGEGIWLTLMIASTLSWTAMHFFLVVLPSFASSVASGPVFQKAQIRFSQDRIADRISPKTYVISYAPAFVFWSTYIFSVVTCFLLLFWLADFFISDISSL